MTNNHNIRSIYVNLFSASSAANTIQLEQHKFVNLLKNVNYSDTALIQTQSGDNGTAESDKCTQFQQSVLKQLAKLVESVGES